MDKQSKKQMWKKGDVRQLQQQAEYFIAEVSPYKGYLELDYVTRDKDPAYFNNIMANRKFLMEKYVKDQYGNPQGPINGRLHGLFFRANVDWRTMAPFPNSPYGSFRLQLPAYHLITPDKHLYFADFYCMHKRGNKVKCNKHNVTLVLCEPGSKADAFCRRTLPQLDIFNNMFMYIGVDGRVFVTNGRGKDGVYVEIFYTEDMDLLSLVGYFTVTEQFAWTRDPNPRKNKACAHCNLT